MSDAIAACKEAKHCVYIGRKCNTSRCAFRDGWLEGWRAGIEAAAQRSQQATHLEEWQREYVALGIRSIPEPEDG